MFAPRVPLGVLRVGRGGTDRAHMGSLYLHLLGLTLFPNNWGNP
jgi:hypothetical protein